MTTQKTTFTGMLRKIFLMAFFFTGVLSATAASATTAIRATLPAYQYAADRDESGNSVLQTNVFIVHNTNTMKVFVIDPESKGAVIVFRNNIGQVIYKSGFINKQSFMGKFDLSQLPAGKYSMEIYKAVKFGLGKKQHATKFEILSQTRRSVSIKPAIENKVIAQIAK